MSQLAETLNIPLPHTVGLRTAMWDFASEFASNRAIGKWSDEEIARPSMWDGSPSEFVKAMAEAWWLDTNETHRITIHDWSEHCEEGIHKKLQRQRLRF